MGSIGGLHMLGGGGGCSILSTTSRATSLSFSSPLKTLKMLRFYIDVAFYFYEVTMNTTYLRCLMQENHSPRVCLVGEPTVMEWNGSIPEERVGSVPVFGRCKKVERVGSVPVFGLEEWNEKLNNRNSKIRQHFICISKKNNTIIYIDIEHNYQQ